MCSTRHAGRGQALDAARLNDRGGGTGPSAQAGSRGHEHARLELLAGMTQELRDVVETLGVVDAAQLAVEAERPVLALAAEDVPRLGRDRCLPLCRRRARPPHLEHLSHAGETLQLDRSPLPEGDIARALAELLQHRGDQDLPAARNARDAGGEDHVLAEEILGLLDHLARVEPDPHLDGFLGMPRAVAAIARCIAIAQRIARRALEKATMKPSPCDFTSKPPWAVTCSRIIALWARSTSCARRSPRRSVIAV